MSSGVASDDGGGGAVGAGIPGDWTCSDSECRHINFARRTQCNKCQRERADNGGSGGDSKKERRSSSSDLSSSSAAAKKKLGTEIGKAAAEKSRGLFSAEDWQCSKCANVNWARRQTCNMCSAPKFSDVEERTGYGGGYNDRGVVEYKEREESDSEYDEFGRLKKKRKNNDKYDENASSDEKPEANANTEETNEKALGDNDDDEEDEEDDGDGDLSKYDLWGDEGINAASVAKLTSNDDGAKQHKSTRPKYTEKKRSRSNSSSSSDSSSSSSTSSSNSSSSSTSSASRSRGGGRSRVRSRSPHSHSHSKTENHRQPSSSVRYRRRTRSRSASPAANNRKRR